MNTTGSFTGDALVLMAYLLAFGVVLFIIEQLFTAGERVWRWLQRRIQ